MGQPQTPRVIVRKAKPADLNAITEIITPFIAEKKLLPRTIDELHELIDTLFVGEVDGELVGCAAIEIYSKKLAEIRSLAVNGKAQGMGVGRMLVEACIAYARERDILEVMAVTSSEDFFKACGFDFTLPGEKKALFFQSRDPESHDHP